MRSAIINIETDLGHKSFNSISELTGWVEAQLEQWRIEQNAINCQPVQSIVNCWDQIHNSLINILNSDNSGKEQTGSAESLLQRNFNEKKIICSENPLIDKAKKLGNIYSVDTFFRGALGHQNNITLNDQNRIRGYILGSIANSDNINYEFPDKDKIDAVYSNNIKELEAIKAEIRVLTEEQKHNNKEVDDLISTIEQRIETTKIAFNDGISALKSNFDNFIKESESKLETIEHTYKKHMSLRASVTYWNEQVEHHEKWSIIGLVILALITTFTMGSIVAFGYFSLMYIGENTVKLEDISYPFILKGFIAALLLSFEIWAIKICNKTWHIHRHLKQDAKERVTMMKTYLALISEENYLKEGDVELILTSLFRPSYDGIIKDETAPRSAFDFLLREAR